MRRYGYWFGVVFALAIPARAQSGAELAARRDLLDQAEQARQRNDHVTALSLAERAGTIQMSPSLRLFLITEQRELGHVADAVGNAESCVREVGRDSTLRNRALILQQCQSVLDTLRAEVGRVVVQVATAPAGMVMHVGGMVVPNTMVGLPFMVRPGEIAVSITAPNFATFERTVTVARGASVDVPVVLVATTTSATQAQQTSSSQQQIQTPLQAGSMGANGAQLGTTNPVMDPGLAQARQQGPGIAPWIVAGIGGASAVAGAVLLGLNASAVGALNSECPTDPNNAAIRNCSMVNSVDLDSRIASANGLATGGIVAAAAGGAIVIGGVLWFALAPRRSGEAQRTAWMVLPSVSGTSAGATVGGVW